MNKGLGCLRSFAYKALWEWARTEDITVIEDRMNVKDRNNRLGEPTQPASHVTRNTSGVVRPDRDIAPLKKNSSTRSKARVGPPSRHRPHKECEPAREHVRDSPWEALGFLMIEFGKAIQNHGRNRADTV